MGSGRGAAGGTSDDKEDSRLFRLGYLPQTQRAIGLLGIDIPQRTLGRGIPVVLMQRAENGNPHRRDHDREEDCQPA